MAELGVQPTSYQRYERPERLQGLSAGVFFDREHFEGDRVVAGWGSRPWGDFFADAPLSAAVRADLIRLHESTADYLPGFESRAERRKL